MKAKSFLFSLLAFVMAAMLSVGVSSCSKDDDSDSGSKSADNGITVSPTSASIFGEKGSTNTLTITVNGPWTLTECPEWLHASATSGNGTTTIILTALSENWSDEKRSATLTFTNESSTASATISQMGTLPSGLRVETSNMTLMSDGFACDLTFGPNAKGYKEAFFTETSMQTMTDQDIYQRLMEKTEYNSLLDYTFSGVYNPNTNLIYCVAAYGNENNTDGTHKYGPITIQRITTKSKTIYDDMYLTKSYNSSTWTVNAMRSGSYGQKCDEYYYLAYEGSDANTMYTYWYNFSDAFIAHFYFKPKIAQNSNNGYTYGPQTMTFQRSSNAFFCITWGIDRETKEFSAELSAPAYYNFSSTSLLESKKVNLNQSVSNEPPYRPTKEEIENARKSLTLYRAKK